MAKRFATTRAMQLCLDGNFKAMASVLNCIANSCISKPCIWRREAINDYTFRHSERMNFKLRVWRQRDAKARGKLIDYKVREISPDTSFLEMLDILNENLIST